MNFRSDTSNIDDILKIMQSYCNIMKTHCNFIIILLLKKINLMVLFNLSSILYKKIALFLTIFSDKYKE